MSTENSTPSVEVSEATATALMIKAWEVVTKAEVGVAVAFDKFRIVAKTECAKSKWSKKQLTSVLLGMGVDKSRTSELSGWVFPTNSANRNLLDEVAAFNSKQTDAKRRIGKEAVLAIQRSEVPRDEHTADDLLATLAKEKAAAAAAAPAADGKTNPDGTASREARPPGSEVEGHGDGTASRAAAAAGSTETPEQVTRRLQDLIAAAMNYAKAKGYDLADYYAECEVVAPIVKIEGFTPEEPATESEAAAE